MIIKNITKENIFIEDLRLKIPLEESIDLTKLGISLEELNSSIEVKDLIYVNKIVVNSNSIDLSISDALEQVSIPVVEGKKSLELLLSGGDASQVLRKMSKINFDFKWDKV